MTPKIQSALQNLRNFLSSYCHFADQSIVRPLSLWIAGTYIFEAFDSYPYLVITAKVKRAGKTRLSELIGFTCQMPFQVAGASAASLFRKIKDDKPTILWDEAETLSSEATSLVRAFLNVGYRKGQSIPRACADGVIELPTYCPKAFVLIGDVYDTLKDRSIIVEMERADRTQIKKHFSYETAKAEGLEIAEELRSVIFENVSSITEAYENISLPFLTDRDEEIWRPIFALAKAIDTESFEQMKRTAVDMATEKTNPVRYVPNEDAEKKREMEEYGFRLLADMLTITKNKKGISSSDAIDALKEIDVAPWRKYLGEGLTMKNMADLLAAYDLRPKPIRMGVKFNGNGQPVYRGYSRKDIEAAAKKAKV
jgi:hypothetical protein